MGVVAGSIVPTKSIKPSAAGDISMVNLVLSQGVDVNALATPDPSCSDATALVVASRAGHETIVLRLLQETTLCPNMGSFDKQNSSRNNQTPLSSSQIFDSRYLEIIYRGDV